MGLKRGVRAGQIGNAVKLPIVGHALEKCVPKSSNVMQMRVLSQSELLSLSRIELMGLLRRIASELTALPEGSHELRIAHYNLRNIRAALARPDFRPR